MMRLVYPSDLRDEIAFAERVAKAMGKDPEMQSYTDGEIVPGCLIGLRWGLEDDCVLVLRLSDYHTPTIYGEVIQSGKGE